MLARLRDANLKGELDVTGLSFHKHMLVGQLDAKRRDAVWQLYS